MSDDLGSADQAVLAQPLAAGSSEEPLTAGNGDELLTAGPSPDPRPRRKRSRKRRAVRLALGSAIAIVVAVAAIAVGIIEAFASFHASSYKEVIVFMLIVPVLLWRSLYAPQIEEDE